MSRQNICRNGAELQDSWEIAGLFDRLTMQFGGSVLHASMCSPWQRPHELKDRARGERGAVLV